jgi:hypothetical protein
VSTPTETKITVATLLVDLKYIRVKLDTMCKSAEERDDRLTNVERVTWAVGVGASILGAIFIPIAVYAIKLWWFGL